MKTILLLITVYDIANFFVIFTYVCVIIHVGSKHTANEGVSLSPPKQLSTLMLS